MLTNIFVGFAFSLVTAGILYLGRVRTAEQQWREARVRVVTMQTSGRAKPLDRAA